MKAFISSVMWGFGEQRGAAERAARTLGYDIIHAEDFGASPNSPQQVCLDGVRAADVIILILGPRYGPIQPSGLSATHEEYHEARREQKAILVFVQDGVEYEPKEGDFVKEVRAWTTGFFTSTFFTVEELRDACTRALHQLALSQAAGVHDVAEITQRAEAQVAHVGPGILCVAVAGGPAQQIVRPSALEATELKPNLMRELTYGTLAIFEAGPSLDARVQNEALVIGQGQTVVTLDQMGTVSIAQDALQRTGRDSFFKDFIEEDVAERIGRSLSLASSLLDSIDPTNRLSHVVPLVAVAQATGAGWYTRAEQANLSNSRSIPAGWGLGASTVTVRLTPPQQTRAAIKYAHNQIVADFITLLRRKMRLGISR